MSNGEARVSYYWLREGLETDEVFKTEALEILKSADPNSTYTTASSAHGLLNLWTVERELNVYERGRLVNDVTDVVLYADMGSFTAAENAVEQGWRIDRGELLMLLLRKRMSIPEFLRLVSAPATDEDPDTNGYTPNGASAYVAKQYGVDYEAMRDQILDAILAKELHAVNPATGMPYARAPSTLRGFYDRVHTSDLNKWFKDNGVPYRLPEYVAPGSDKASSEHPRVGGAMNAVPGSNAAHVWQAEARRVADTLHLKDLQQGAFSSLEDMASRVAQDLRARRIHGPRTPLSEGTILREALRKVLWKRPSAIGKTGKTGNPE